MSRERAKAFWAKACCREFSINRWILLTVCVFQITLYGGVIYGWPSLSLILRRQGVYADYPQGCEALLNLSSPVSSASSETKIARRLQEDKSSFATNAATGSDADGHNLSGTGTIDLEACESHQDLRLGQVYTAGSWAILGSRFFIGFFLDHFGVRASNAVSEVSCPHIFAADQIILIVCRRSVHC